MVCEQRILYTQGGAKQGTENRDLRDVTVRSGVRVHGVVLLSKPWVLDWVYCMPARQGTVHARLFVVSGLGGFYGWKHYLTLFFIDPST